MATAPHREVLPKPFIFAHKGEKHEIFDTVLADAIGHRDQLLKAFADGVDSLGQAGLIRDREQREEALMIAYKQLRTLRADLPR